PFAERTIDHGQYLVVVLDQLRLHDDQVSIVGASGCREAVKVVRDGQDIHGLGHAARQFANHFLLAVYAREGEGQIAIDIGQRLCRDRQIPGGLLEEHELQALNVDGGGATRLAFLGEIRPQTLQRLDVVVLDRLDRLPICLNLRTQASKRGFRELAVTPVLAPLFAGETEKDADTDQQDLEADLEQRFSPRGPGTLRCRRGSLLVVVTLRNVRFRHVANATPANGGRIREWIL